MKTDILIVGTGVAGLFCALNLPADRNILMVTKSDIDESDSFLAQGGICVLRDDDDYERYFEDTMRAGHYENNPETVEIMIRSSQDVIRDLVRYGVDFNKKDGEFVYTREGAHSMPRILFHKDITGKEITSKLIEEAGKRKNIRIKEHFTMVDIIEENGECVGIAGRDENNNMTAVYADYTVLATGGIGGIFKNSTNFPHLTGDSVAIAAKHGAELLNVDYIQIHPTTLYSEKEGRRFLISESVRGEGAVLLNKDGDRFVNELLPRDVVAEAIHEQMKKDGMPYVKLSLKPISKAHILSHFPNIYKRCLEEGYDITKEDIPVVPAQHYFMGGVKVNSNSKTTMDRMYAVGETACNGVHGRNRLASNSLLESIVFAKRAAKDISENYSRIENYTEINPNDFADCGADYKEIIEREIKKRNKDFQIQ